MLLCLFLAAHKGCATERQGFCLSRSGSFLRVQELIDVLRLSKFQAMELGPSDRSHGQSFKAWLAS